MMHNRVWNGCIKELKREYFASLYTESVILRALMSSMEATLTMEVEVVYEAAPPRSPLTPLTEITGRERSWSNSYQAHSQDSLRRAQINLRLLSQAANYMSEEAPPSLHVTQDTALSFLLFSDDNQNLNPSHYLDMQFYCITKLNSKKKRKKNRRTINYNLYNLYNTTSNTSRHVFKNIRTSIVG